jgi:AcrR family transcriptional regulator
MKRKETKNAAFVLFAKQGYHDSSMQQIAEAVDINKATLYYYFKSKAELYTEIMQDLIPPLCNMLLAAISNIPKDRLERKLKSIYMVLISKLPYEEILLWKRTMLMCTDEYDATIKESARRLFHERDTKISQIIRDIITDTGCNYHMCEEQINTYITLNMALIRGLADLILINYSMDEQIDRVALADKVWEQFWLGSGKLLVINA